MGYSNDLKEKAKMMFVNEGKKCYEIAKLLRVPITTIYRWKKKYKWDDYIKAGGMIGIAIELQKQYIDQIGEAIKKKKLSDPGVADRLVKISKVLENMMPKAITLSNIFNLFEVLAEFVANNTDDDFIKSFQKYMPEMSDYLREKFAS